MSRLGETVLRLIEFSHFSFYKTNVKVFSSLLPFCNGGQYIVTGEE